MKKLRVRNHQVVLNRSVGGDTGITIILVLFGAFMFIPMYYTVIQSFKPYDELFLFPPRFYIKNPTLKNYTDLFRLMSTSWVPFSRYIFNTVLISVVGTLGNLVLSSLAAYVLSKMKFPGREFFFQTIVLSRYLLGCHCADLRLNPRAIPDEAVYGVLRFGCGAGERTNRRRLRVPNIPADCNAHG